MVRYWNSVPTCLPQSVVSWRFELQSDHQQENSEINLQAERGTFPIGCVSKIKLTVSLRKWDFRPKQYGVRCCMTYLCSLLSSHSLSYEEGGEHECYLRVRTARHGRRGAPSTTGGSIPETSPSLTNLVSNFFYPHPFLLTPYRDDI